MRAAVVGHVEWVRFARVERVPEPGAIVAALDSWEEPGGGGADAAGDRQHPGAQVVRVLQPPVAAKGAQECLLVGILRVAAEKPAKFAQDCILVLFVERFERRDMHESHHLL